MIKIHDQYYSQKAYPGKAKAFFMYIFINFGGERRIFISSLGKPRTGIRLLMLVREQVKRILGKLIFMETPWPRRRWECIKLQQHTVQPAVEKLSVRSPVTRPSPVFIFERRERTVSEPRLSKRMNREWNA